MTDQPIKRKRGRPRGSGSSAKGSRIKFDSKRFQCFLATPVAQAYVCSQDPAEGEEDKTATKQHRKGDCFVMETVRQKGIIHERFHTLDERPTQWNATLIVNNLWESSHLRPSWPTITGNREQVVHIDQYYEIWYSPAGEFFQKAFTIRDHRNDVPLLLGKNALRRYSTLGKAVDTCLRLAAEQNSRRMRA